MSISRKKFNIQMHFVHKPHHPSGMGLNNFTVHHNFLKVKVIEK